MSKPSSNNKASKEDLYYRKINTCVISYLIKKLPIVHHALPMENHVVSICDLNI